MHPHRRRERERKDSDAASSNASHSGKSNDAHANTTSGPENADPTYNNTPQGQRSSHTPHSSANDSLTRSNALAQMDTLHEPIFANAHHDLRQSSEADASRSILLGPSIMSLNHPHHILPRTPSQSGATLSMYTRRTSSSVLPRSTGLDTNLADESASLAPPLPTYSRGSGTRSSSSSTSGSAHGQPHPRQYPVGQAKPYPLSSSEQRPLPDSAREAIPTTSTYPSSSMPMHSDSVSQGKPNAAGGNGFLANSVNVPSRNEAHGVVNDNHNNRGDMNSMGPTATSTNNIAVNLPHLNELFNTPVDDAGFPLPSLGTDLNSHQLATDVDITAHSHLNSTGAVREEAVPPSYPSFQPAPSTQAQPPSQSQPQPAQYSPQPLQPLYQSEHSRETLEEMDGRSRSHQVPQYYQGVTNPQQEEARTNTTQTYHPPPYPPHSHHQQQPQQFPQQPHQLRSTMQTYPQQDTERQSRQYVDRSRGSMRPVSHALPNADPSWPNPSQASASLQLHANSHGHGHRTHVRHQSHPSPYPRSISNVARPSTSAIPPSSAHHGLQQWSPTMSGNAPPYPPSQPQQPQGNTVGPHRSIQRHRALSSPIHRHPAPAPYDSSPAQPPQYSGHEYRGDVYGNRDAFEYEAGVYVHGGQQLPYATSRNSFSAEEPFGAAGVGKGKKAKDPRPHKCTECGKGFPRPSALNTHMSVHSGEKPYRCPVVSCDKTFAVRSNARRHLKIHGIKLKTRDRSGGKKLNQEQDATSDDDLRYDQDTGDEGEDASLSPKAAHKTANPPASTLAKRVDTSRAPHRGHTNTLGDGPLGIGAALSMLEFIPASANTSTTAVAPSVKEVQVKRVARSDRQWILQSSSAAAASAKLRRQRESLSADRRRRGSRSEEQDLTTTTTTMTKRASVTTTIKQVMGKGADNPYDPSSDDYADHEHDDDVEATGVEMEDEGASGDIEGEEVEVGEGMTLVGPSTTISIPQLDRDALDKLIAPPTAWEGFQKQRKMAASGLSLDQRLQSHISSTSNSASRYEAAATSSSSYINAPGAATSSSTYQSAHATSLESFPNTQTRRLDTVHGPQEAFSPERHNANLRYRREGSGTTMSNEALHSSTNMPYNLPSSDTVPPLYPIPSSSSANSGYNMPMTASSGFSHSPNAARSSGQMWAAGSSPFLTSSMRSSAGGSVLPAHNNPNYSSAVAKDIVSPVAGPSSRIANPTATTATATGTSELGTSMVGEWRDDGTWIPRSMVPFQNLDRLRNQPPFDDAGLDEPNVNVPLSAMQPSQDPASINGTESLRDMYRPTSHQQYQGHRHHPYQHQRPQHLQARAQNGGVTYGNDQAVGPYPYHPDNFGGFLPGPANNQLSAPTFRHFPIAV